MKIKAIFAAILVAGMILLAAPMAANASEAMRFTHPQVKGIATCNTVTGTFDLAWSVSGDPGYPNVTGTFVSATRVADQIVNKVSKGGAIIQATETNVAAGTYTLDVGIQFDNHKPGDIVHNTGTIIASGDCVQLYPATGTVVFVDSDCRTATDNTFTVNTEPATTANYIIDGVDQGSVSGGVIVSQGAVVVTLTGTDGSVLVFEHTFVLADDSACVTSTPTPVPPVTHGPQLAATGPADDQFNTKLGFAAALLVLVGLALAGLGALGAKR